MFLCRTHTPTFANDGESKINRSSVLIWNIIRSLIRARNSKNHFFNQNSRILMESCFFSFRVFPFEAIFTLRYFSVVIDVCVYVCEDFVVSLLKPRHFWHAGVEIFHRFHVSVIVVLCSSSFEIAMKNCMFYATVIIRMHDNIPANLVEMKNVHTNCVINFHHEPKCQKSHTHTHTPRHTQRLR